jgi:hypothetical protein
LTIRADYVGKFTHDMPTSNLVSLNQLDPKYLSLGNLLLADINSPEAVAAGIPIPYPGFTGSVAQALRPFPQFDAIPQVDSKTASSHYNALELTLRERFGRGLNLIAAYTISKNLGNDQATCLQCYGAPQFIQHTDFRGRYHALLLADVPQVFTLGYTYELPFGSGKRFLNSTNSVVDHLVGGWSVSGIHIYESGTPVSISTNVAIPSVSGVWANRVPGIPIRTGTSCSNYNPNNPGNLYLDAGAFTDPAPFTFGNTSVLSSVRTCGYTNESLSIFKHISIHENIGVQFGADFLNAFNRHSWTGLDSNIDDTAGFGRYTGTSAPRIIQLRVRVSF